MATVEELKGQIQRRYATLQETKAEQKARREQIFDGLDNDSEYRELKEKAAEASKRANAHKQALLNEPEYRKLTEDMKDTAKELKDCEALLSGELLGYNKETDSFEFEDGGGQLHRIQFKGRLVKTDQPSLF